MTDFLDLRDFTKSELIHLLSLTKKLSNSDKKHLKGKILALIFEKPSTRTSLSFMVAMENLGGHSIYFKQGDLQLSRGEPIKDVARVFTRQVDGIAARVYAHKELLELSRYTDIPVINTLSDLSHPCQVLADFYVLKERFERLRGLKLAYIGDGNNVCNSLITMCSKFGLTMDIACPRGYDPDKNVLKDAKKQPGEINILRDPKKAVKNANIIYTDVWVSMGMDGAKERILKDFKNYQINSKLLANVKNDYIFMHCLPAHRGLEITEEVIEGPNSVVWDQAYSRMLTSKALLYHFLKN